MKWIALGLWVAVASAYLFVVPGSTDRRLLRAGPFRTTGRSWRAFIQWLVAAALSWPYLWLRVLGLGRRPAPGRESEVVWQMGPLRLRRFPGSGGRPPVLVVHSFISRPSILDLAPGRSLVGALADAGHDVHLLDWGEPSAAQAPAGFDSYVAALHRAVDVVADRTASKQVPVVGYCMGAVLALAADADKPGRIANIAALAPSGDLAVTGGLHRLMQRRVFRPAWVLDGRGLVPGPIIRESFHALRPDAIRSGWRAWRAGRKDAGYRLIADGRARWAFDQPAIPGALLFDLVEMTRRNSLLDRLGGSTAPLLLAIADRDHIVPPASSLSLAVRPRVEVRHFDSGHVAMLTGREAASTLYPALIDWLEQDRRPGTTVSA